MWFNCVLFSFWVLVNNLILLLLVQFDNWYAIDTYGYTEEVSKRGKKVPQGKKKNTESIGLELTWPYDKVWQYGSFVLRNIDTGQIENIDRQLNSP